MTDKTIKDGATIERKFGRSVDKAYDNQRKQLLKDLKPFLNELKRINSDADILFPKGDRRKDAWKCMKRRDAVNAYKVAEKIEKALNAAWRSCEREYANGLFHIGSDNFMTELEGVLDEDI